METKQKSNHYWEDRLPSPLNNNECCICNSHIVPINEAISSEVFTYRCDTCNPKLTIKITGSLLTTNLYGKFREDIAIRSVIQKRIRFCSDSTFLISTFLIRDALNLTSEVFVLEE